MTPREALDRIAAVVLPPSPGQRTTSDEIREILAEVSPEPGGATSDDHQRGYAQGYTEGRAAGWDERGEPSGVLDRDQARAVQLDRRDPREAAAAIAAQILGRQRTGPLSDEDLGRYVADSVLAAVVHPGRCGDVVPGGGVLDRDQSRNVLDRFRRGEQGVEVTLDHLAQFVRPAAIDRDALSTILRSYGVDGDALDEALDRIEALVRPAGVTLTLEEARRARDWFSLMSEDVTPDPADRALAARLAPQESDR